MYVNTCHVFLYLVLKVRVLFEETFYNAKQESFQVLCIDQPLEGGLGK